MHWVGHSVPREPGFDGYLLGELDTSYRTQTTRNSISILGPFLVLQHFTSADSSEMR